MFYPHTRWSQNFTNPTCRSEHTSKTNCQTYPTVTHVEEGQKSFRQRTHLKHTKNKIYHNHIITPLLHN